MDSLLLTGGFTDMMFLGMTYPWKSFVYWPSIGFFINRSHYIGIWLIHNWISPGLIDWLVAGLFCIYWHDWARANKIPKTMDNAVDSAASLYWISSILHSYIANPFQKIIKTDENIFHLSLPMQTCWCLESSFVSRQEIKSDINKHSLRLVEISHAYISCSWRSQNFPYLCFRVWNSDRPDLCPEDPNERWTMLSYIPQQSRKVLLNSRAQLARVTPWTKRGASAQVGLIFYSPLWIRGRSVKWSSKSTIWMQKASSSTRRWW